MIGARMADRLVDKDKTTPLFTGLALVLAWHLIWAAASGMETMLFCVWTLLLIWLTWRELDYVAGDMLYRVPTRGFIFGIAAALATLTRPEGILLAGLCGMMMVIVNPRGTWRGAFFWSVGAALGFAIFITPYLLLNLQLTGGFLPATADAKYAQHLPIIQMTTYPQRLLLMFIPIIAGGQLLLLPGVIYFTITMFQQSRQNRRALFFLLPLLWIIGLIALYAARLPASYQHGRYVIPAIPALIVVGVVGTAQLTQHGRKSPLSRILTRTLAFSAVLAFVYFGCILGVTIYRQDVRIINEEMVASAEWMAANIPPEELLAVHDIGAVGYFAQRPILDIAGLVSLEIVPIYDTEAVWDVMRERDVRYLMAFPDQIPGVSTEDDRLCLLFESNGRTALNAGGGKMQIYRLAWDRLCPN